jgi:hypothetical protein
LLNVGYSLSISLKRSLGIRNIRQSVSALPVARNGVPASSGTSAKNAPGVKVFITTSPPFTSLVILSSPSRIA